MKIAGREANEEVLEKIHNDLCEFFQKRGIQVEDAINFMSGMVVNLLFHAGMTHDLIKERLLLIIDLHQQVTKKE